MPTEHWKWGAAGVRRTPRETWAAAANRRLARIAAEERWNDAYDRWLYGVVYPYKITAALDLRQLYGPEVDAACGVAEPCVDMWEDGQLYPTWEQLCALAALTHFPVGFFTTPAPNGEPIRLEQTSHVFHLKRGEKVGTTPAVIEFLPEAIAAVVDSAPRTPPPLPARSDGRD